MFYAGSILAVDTLGFHCWVRGEDGKAKVWWLALISRVADKSASFTMIQLEFMMKKYMASGAIEGRSRLQMISDCGTHFRAYAVLGTCGHTFLESLRQQIQEVCWHVLPEAHAKNAVDGLFSQLREAARTMSLVDDILSDADLCLAYETWWAHRRTIDPTKPPAEFVLYQPDRAKHLVRLSAFSVASLPFTVRGVHRWQMRLNDKRRKHIDNGNCVFYRFGLEHVWLQGGRCGAGSSDQGGASDPSWSLDFGAHLLGSGS